ncbi:MAG: helix-turn-helix transcriptional regulator [Bacteriovoracaceae bacterium]
MPRKESDRSKSDRLNKIKSIISKLSEEEAMSITELWEEVKSAGFDVNRKTIERDIGEDLTINTPLASTGTNPERYFYPEGLGPDYELKFNDHQLQTIILALQNLKNMSSKLIKGYCVDAEDTLISKLPQSLANEFEVLKSISSSGHTALGESGELEEETYTIVTSALRSGFSFECFYHSPYDPKKNNVKRNFGPLMLHFVGGAPYIFVYDEDDPKKMIKSLRINRIKEPRITTNKVDKKRRKEINLEHAIGGYGTGNHDIIEYVIYCSDELAKRFEEYKIHPSQKISKIKTNEYKIKFTLVNSTEVVRILSQYGDFIYRIEPDTVYRQVKEIWRKGLRVKT